MAEIIYTLPTSADIPEASGLSPDPALYFGGGTFDGGAILAPIENAGNQFCIELGGTFVSGTTVEETGLDDFNVFTDASAWTQATALGETGPFTTDIYNSITCEIEDPFVPYCNNTVTGNDCFTHGQFVGDFLLYIPVFYSFLFIIWLITLAFNKLTRIV